MPSGVLLDRALIDPEPASQLIDGNAVDIALDQLLHLYRVKASTDPFRGSKGGLRLGCGPFQGSCADVIPGQGPESVDCLLDRLV